MGSTWGAILNEIQSREVAAAQVYDDARLHFLVQLNELTKRDTILYASDWTSGKPVPPELVSVIPEDVQGFMEVVHGLEGPHLDLVVHSPGGSAEAIEAIVGYLRKKFTHIRAIIPQAAMSAATMLACAADEIWMGKHSSLGPIDPQMILQTPLGIRMVPAHSILDQFEWAKEEGSNPEKLGPWLPMLEQYGPGLLVECKRANELSKQLAAQWLEQYMFAGQKDAKPRAEDIAHAMSDKGFKSHSRFIDRDAARSLGGHGLIVHDLESDQALQDAVLGLFHSSTHTFNARPVAKIIENQLGKAFIKIYAPSGDHDE